MSRLLSLLALLCSLSTSSNGQYYLTHIDIVDVENGKIIKDQTVYVDGNRIASISSMSVRNPGATAYDCKGKYLLPGLWDMHIHDGGDDSSNRFEYVPLFLANGVTGIRDMWGNPEMLKLRSDIDSGRFTGPRIVLGSPIVDGDRPFWRGSLRAATESQGRQLVDSLQGAGYDFIKIYSLVREPVYLAIADECKKMKIPLEGHLPIGIGFEQAVAAGQRSFEHNFGVNTYLTGQEADKLGWARHWLDTVKSTRNPRMMVHGEPLNVTEKDFHLSDRVLAMMKQNRVAVVPTLTVARAYSIASEELAKQTKGLEYLSSEFLEFWMKQTPDFPTELVQTYGAAARWLDNKGVLILAGTDVNNPFCVPGFGLQQELINLREAGLTNLQVLQAATLNPAKFLFREKELGSVTPGKLADLVVLDENPLTDVSNCQKINAVIANGKYISKEEITKMLAAQKKR